MNRLEEIKLKVHFEQQMIEHKKKSGQFNPVVDADKWDYVDHVLHLLSKLEIASDALNEFTRDSNWDYDEYGIPRWNGAEDTHPSKLAAEALEQIRS